MRAGSGLVSGTRPAPELARDAVDAALDAAGLDRADQVILFLTRDFARHAQPAVLAAARAGGCLAVCGSTASGVLTERGWQMDQPAAAALVYASPAATTVDGEPRLSFSGHACLPFAWQTDPARVGLLDSQAAVWQQGRTSDKGCAEATLLGVRSRIAVTSGLRPLGGPLVIDQTRGYELQRVAGQTAVDSLLRVLPGELREHPPWHHLAALRNGGEPGIAILSSNADGSLMLAEELAPGETVTWSIRQPLSTEQAMRQALATAAEGAGRPDFALLLSCIGRGPLFYGDDDRDLLAFRERFPDTPLLGAYGGGQIVPHANGNRLFHNTALTLLLESAHV